MPISANISCVASPVTGRRAGRAGSWATIFTSARKALLAVDDVARDVLGELLDEEGLARSPPSSMASSKSSGKRDMCTPFWVAIEVDEALDGPPRRASPCVPARRGECPC